MKRILTLSFLSVLVTTALWSQNRLVFIEEFTQASCPPCEATTPALNAVLEANAEKVVQIRYHTSWPGADPMNTDNPTDVRARVDYYGVEGVPNVQIDGTTAQGAGSELVTTDEINTRSAVSSPITIALTHEFNEDNSQMTMNVSITNDGSDAYNVSSNRLRVAVVEEVIEWPTRPGSTSLQVFEAVMKTFATGVAGVTIPEIAAGETWEESFTVDVPQTAYNLLELAAVAWVQNEDTRDVVNAAESHPIALNGDYKDVSISNETSSTSFCDTSVEPAVTITNTGSVELTEAMITVNIDGAAFATETYTGALAPGASEDFSFSSLATVPGETAFDYEVVSINGGESDVRVFAPFTFDESIYIFDEFTSLEDDFESYSFRETGDFIREGTFGDAWITVTPAQFANSNAVGHMSANALFINFWGWATIGDEASLYYGEVDMTSAMDPTFSFVYTGARYQTSQDQILFEVSTDCGQNWTELWSAAGAELATEGAINNSIYVVSPNSTWQPVEVDLSAYAGESNVSFRMRAISGYGNAVYLDDFVLNGLSVSNNEVVDETLASIYPNPANATTLIDLDLSEASEVMLQVTDLNGKTVDTRNYGLLSGAQTLEYDVDALSNGLYIFNVIAGDVVSPQRVSVIK